MFHLKMLSKLLTRYGDINVLNDEFNVKTVITSIINSSDQDLDTFYLCNLNKIIQRFELWTTHLPNIQPYYAVKCNDDELVLQILADLGVNFDCASSNEILKVKNLGVESNRIIFANSIKIPSHIEKSSEFGINFMTFDSESELHKIKRCSTNVKLLLRIAVKSFDCLHPLNGKFGCEPGAESERIIDRCKHENMNLIGITFHVGSLSQSAEAFKQAIILSRKLFRYAKTIGLQLNVLDIGGGFSGDDNSLDLFYKMSSVIKTTIAQHFYDVADLRVISEPGRFFVANAFILAAKIYSKKLQLNEIMYYIPVGIYNSFHPLQYIPQIAPVKVLNYTNKKPEKHFKSIFWGPTCDSKDCVENSSLLPELQVGDWLYFENMGAYASVTSTQFNGFTNPRVVYCIEKDKV